MSANLYLTTLCLPLATVLIVFGLRYWSAVQQAKARLASDEAYRKVAETAAQAEAQTAASLAAIQAALAEIGARVGAVEKVLKDVG